MLIRRLKCWRQPLVYDFRPLIMANPGGQPPFEEALAEWAQWCASHAGARVRVNLSAHWCLVALAEHPKEVWQQYHGLTSETLQTQWVIRQQAVAPERVLACAVPRSLMQDIMNSARQHHVHLVWVGPWWMSSLAQCMSQPVSSAMQWVEQEPGLKVCAQFEGAPGANPHLHRLWCEALPA